MKFAMVFPGQGSQSVGMMSGFGEAPIVRQTFDEASAVLGRDLWALVTDGPGESLSQTVNTQPLMLAAGVATHRLWVEQGGMQPCIVAGHSLGEYAALVVADAISFADAVMLVELRARSMQEAVPSGEGAMAAILGIDAATVVAACAESAQGQVVEAVNFNAPEQIVIAGHAGAVQRAADACKRRGAKRAMLLPVSAPFHCSLMRPAADRLRERVASVAMRTPSIPVLNNVDVACQIDPALIKDALVRQAAGPVRWVETMQAMAAQGISHVLESGPGKVLAGLAKRCSDRLVGTSLGDLAGLQGALAIVKGSGSC